MITPDFKRDFNLSFMTSSLLFVASAVGSEPNPSLPSGRPELTPAYRYALGTLSVELVTSTLGRTRFYSAKTPTVLPLPSFRPRGPDSENDVSVLGFSIHRCRFLTLALMSVSHSTFFMIMGSKSGFPSMLVAYAISAFSRSFILGKLESQHSGIFNVSHSSLSQQHCRITHTTSAE